MAEHQLPKLNTRVRFPSSAPGLTSMNAVRRCSNGVLATRGRHDPVQSRPRGLDSVAPVPGTALRATRDCRPRCSPRSRTRRCPVSAVRLLARALAVRSTSAHHSPDGANYQACASRSSAIRPGWRTPLFFCVGVDRSTPYHNVCGVLSDVGATIRAAARRPAASPVCRSLVWSTLRQVVFHFGS